MYEDEVEWLVREDEEILELLQSDDVFTPDHVAEEFDYLRSPDVAYRCRELANHGLLDKHAIGMYEVSDLGERYLAGELDPSDLADDEDGDNGDDTETNGDSED